MHAEQSSHPREQIFNCAADLRDPAERAAFLDEACGGDAALRGEIEELLRHDEAAGSFLEAVPLASSPVSDGSDPDSAAAAPEPGTILGYFGDYELLEEVARGGMGVVYKARQTSLNRTVGLKMILAGQLASDEDVRRFQTEAEAAANLQHPNIVSIHEIGQHDGQHFFSMDFVDGRSLAEVVRENPLPARQAAEYVRRIAEAIQYAHGQGTLHRDLKPHNVLIDRNDEPRITDFGLAKRIEADSKLTVTGTVVGTPSYMPPEQIAADRGDVGPASDIYSLGAVLYELVTGRPPFQADAPLDTMKQVLEVDPVPPQMLNPAVPRDVETICLKCLEKNSQRRYRSAQELADELGRFLRGEPIHARPVGRVERCWRWSRRHPATAALSGVLVLTLVLAMLGGYVMAVRESRLRNQAQQSERASRTHLYIAEMNLARQAWRNSELHRVEEILETYRPGPGDEDLRGWEWYYLLAMCHRSVLTIEDVGMTYAVSPDGREIAAVASGRPISVRIYDLETGRVLTTLEGSDDSIFSIAWSPDGTRLASAGGDGTVRVQERSTGDLICTLAGHTESVVTLEWCPDGTLLASGTSDGEIRIWDVSREQMVVQLDTDGYVTSLAWRPDGRQLVSAGVTAGLMFWDVQTWDEATTDVPPRDLVQSCYPYAAAWDPAGRRLAVGGMLRGMQPVGFVWERETEQRVMLSGHTREVKSLAWSADGTRLATGSDDKTVRVWDVATGEQQLLIRGHEGRIDQIHWTADGEHVVASGGGRIDVWDAAQPQDAIVLANESQGFGGDVYFQWNADSTELVVSRGSQISLADVNGRVESWMDRSGPVAWSPDGRYIAVIAAWDIDSAGRQQIEIWSTSSMEVVGTLAGHRGAVRNLCFNPDGTRLASTSLGWRYGHDGQEVWQVESDRVIRIWDVEACTETLSIETGRSDYVDCIAWSPKGSTICWGRGEQVGLVDADTGESLQKFSVGAGLRALDWSPAGDEVVVGFWSVNGFAVFEAATGEKRREFTGHTMAVNDVSWNPDGTRIASASEDGTIRIWNATSGREVLEIPQSTLQRADARAVHWSPDGKRLAAWQDGVVKIFDASTGYAREFRAR